MKQSFTLFRRGRVFYSQDTTTGLQASLRTHDRGEACTLLQARNEAHRQPFLNLQIARTYLTAVDPEISRRPWRVVMAEMAKGKTGVTLKPAQKIEGAIFALNLRLSPQRLRSVSFPPMPQLSSPAAARASFDRS